MAEDVNQEGGAEARIRKLIEEKKALEARVAELEPFAGEVGKYRSAADEAKAALAAEREALKAERVIYAAGITDEEGMSYVQHAYSRLPAQDRPALGDWLAAKDALPKAVRAYLPEAAAAPVAAPDARMKLPAASANALPSPAAQPTAFSPQAIMSMSPSEFKANFDAIKAARSSP